GRVAGRAGRVPVQRPVVQPGEAVADDVRGQGVHVGDREGLTGGVVHADHRRDGDLVGRDPVGVLEVLHRLDRRLRHLAAAAGDDAHAAGRAGAVVHGHQVDDVVVQAGTLHRLDDLVAERVHTAVAAVGGAECGEREGELQVRVLRLCSDRGGDEVLDVRLALAAFDVEVDADHVRAGVTGDEGLHAGGRGTGGGRGAAPVLAAAGAGGERQRDGGQFRNVLGHHAPGTHDRQDGPARG